MRDMLMKYRLEGREVVEHTGSFEEWAYWYGNPDARIVRQEDVADASGTMFFVSTVMLGIDHSFDPNSPPVLFETMVFAGSKHSPGRAIDDGDTTRRYSTYDEAERGHEEVVALVRGMNRRGKRKMQI